MKRAGLLVAVVLLALPAAAQATIHYGAASFEPPSEEPSIGTQPPLCNPQETRVEERGKAEGPDRYSCTRPTEGLRTVNVAYNDQTGSLTIKVSVYDPQLWGPVLAQQGFGVSSTCDDPTPSLQGNFLGQDSAWTDEDELIEGEEPNAVTLQGHRGEVVASTSWSSTGYAFTWTDRAFARRSWRCLALERGGSVRLGSWPKRRSATAVR
jgi:hypothetical protein